MRAHDWGRDQAEAIDILLADDTSGRNIDTLGQSGKRFRYYLEPSNHLLDRRDPTRQKHCG